MTIKHKIEDIAMSVRLKTCLKNHGILYIEEIFDYTDEDYFNIRNIGRKCIYEAQQLVAEYRLNQ